MTLDEFSRDTLETAGKVGFAIAKVIRDCSGAVVEEVVRATPVDTGEARSNWIASIGAPTDETRPPFAPGHKLGLEETENADRAIEEAKKVLSGVKRSNDVVYIQNNLPYIEVLNGGSSEQAPPLFIETAVDRAVGSPVDRSLERFGDDF